MSTQYYENLIRTVLDNSYNKDWDLAVLEWKIIDCEENEFTYSACICGKEDIRYLYRIQNIITGNSLFPIGSTCIKKFNRTDLNETTSLYKELFKLRDEVQKNNFIKFNTQLFSRKLLKYLFDEGAFKPTKYNQMDGRNDYDFMLDMFNQRRALTNAQQRKVKAILLSSIKPFIMNKLKNKNVNH